jgi:hypothetical protein
VIGTVLWQKDRNGWWIAHRFVAERRQYWITDRGVKVRKTVRLLALASEGKLPPWPVETMNGGTLVPEFIKVHIEETDSLRREVIRAVTECCGRSKLEAFAVALGIRRAAPVSDLHLPQGASEHQS